VKGIVKVTRFSIPTCPVASIDPRFSTDKVLGKLMKLAQQKHDKQYPKDKVYCCGDMHIGSHEFHIACDPAMDKDKVKVIAVCHLGDVVEPDCVVVSQKDLDRIFDAIEDAKSDLIKVESELDHVLNLVGGLA
jgi:hypothetical protein